MLQAGRSMFDVFLTKWQEGRDEAERLQQTHVFHRAFARLKRCHRWTTVCSSKPMTKLLFGIFGILVLSNCFCLAEITPTNSSPCNLVIASSSAPVTGGKVNLKIGELRFSKGFYVGKYDIKVSPYFFHNENGDLKIDAPEPSLRKWVNGDAVDFTGKATSSEGSVKLITGKITPTGQDQGTVSLWFMTGKRKLTFNTTYRSVKE